jgi:hypothetical protein
LDVDVVQVGVDSLQKLDGTDRHLQVSVLDVLLEVPGDDGGGGEVVVVNLNLDSVLGVYVLDVLEIVLRRELQSDFPVLFTLDGGCLVVDFKIIDVRPVHLDGHNQVVLYQHHLYTVVLALSKVLMDLLGHVLV